MTASPAYAGPPGLAAVGMLFQLKSQLNLGPPAAARGYALQHPVPGKVVYPGGPPPPRGSAALRCPRPGGSPALPTPACATPAGRAPRRQVSPSMVARGDWGEGDDRRLLRAVYAGVLGGEPRGLKGF